MPERICGDAFLLRINARYCSPEIAPEESKFQNMVYEDVPKELLGSPLLWEMTQVDYWKVLPLYGNVVRLGYFRMHQGAPTREDLDKLWAQEAGRKKREEMTRNQREQMERRMITTSQTSVGLPHG